MTNYLLDNEEVVMEKKPSDIIEEFIKLLENSHSEYLNSKAIVDNFDKETLNWVHKIENTDKAEERSKISTAWYKERKERRKHKNNMILYEKVHKFAIEEQNKSTLKRLKSMLQKQIETEEYLGSENKVLKSQRRLE